MLNLHMIRGLGLDNENARCPSFDVDLWFEAVKQNVGADVGGKNISCQCYAVRDDVRTRCARSHEHIPKYFGFIMVR